MPQFLKDILLKAAASKGLTGERADHYAYGAMNNMGAMHGSKITPKGQRMDAKHTRDMGLPHPHRNLGKFLHPKKAR